MATRQLPADGPRARARAILAAGDYTDVAQRLLPELGAILVGAAGVRPGERVLDVAAGAGNVAIPAALHAIAACESGGDPRAVGGGGAFRGKYQFDYGTWARVGGTGDPAAAPEIEQDRRAALLYARAGAAPWPVCGQ